MWFLFSYALAFSWFLPPPFPFHSCIHEIIRIKSRDWIHLSWKKYTCTSVYTLKRDRGKKSNDMYIQCYNPIWFQIEGLSFAWDTHRREMSLINQMRPEVNKFIKKTLKFAQEGSKFLYQMVYIHNNKLRERPKRREFLFNTRSDCATKTTNLSPANTIPANNNNNKKLSF